MNHNPDSASTRPYATGLQPHRTAGWSNVIPLGPAGGGPAKAPPRPDYTGRNAAQPDEERYEAWLRDYGDNNIGIWLQPGTVALDVDHYRKASTNGRPPAVKRGADTIRDLEAELGPLPPGPRSTSRGAANPSGIRPFQVLEGLEFVTKLPGDVEVIQPKHRYAVVWPSVHPDTGKPYRWLGPDGKVLQRPPRVDELPVLPKAWRDYLVSKAAEGLDREATIDDEDARAWFEAHTERMCRAMRNVATMELERLQSADVGSRYDTAVESAMAVVKLASEGHRGAKTAMRRLRVHYHEVVAGEAHRDPTEWARLVIGAVAKAGGDCAPKHADGDCPDRPEFRTEYHRTDDGNALRLFDLFRDRFRCNPHDRAAPARVDDGARFARDVGGVRMAQLARETVTAMHHEAAEIDDEDARKAALKWVLSCENKAKRDAMIASVLSFRDIVAYPPEFDADAYLLNLLNGVLDLQTGKLLSHSPEYLMTKLAPTDWRGIDFIHPDWEETLDRFVRPGDEDGELEAYLGRAAFASLTGKTTDKRFLNPYDEYGGDTGKTTFIESILAVLGPDYSATVGSDVFLTDRHGSKLGTRSELAKCAGMRMVVSSELPPAGRLNATLMKKLTAGVGSFQFEEKYVAAWEQEITFTIWLDGNSIARAQAEDSPLFGRWGLMPFRHQIPVAERDEKWADKHKTDPDYRSAVLSWAMRHREAWLEYGIDTCPVVEAAVHDAQQTMNPLGEFWEANLETGRSVRGYRYDVTTDEAVALYRDEGDGSVESEANIRALFMAYVRSLPGVVSKAVKREGKTTQVWDGVRIRTITDESE